MNCKQQHQQCDEIGETMDVNLCLFEDLLIAHQQLNARGLVLHLPKKSATEIAQIMQQILNATRRYKTPFLLENMPGEPDEHATYESPEKLNRLSNELNRLVGSAAGWYYCIDTAHLWNSGVDISRASEMRKWLDELSHLTLTHVKLIHLNGSINPITIFKDTHTIPGLHDDKIWSKIPVDDNTSQKHDNQSGFHYLVKFAKKNNISMICEVVGSNAELQHLFDKIKAI